MRDYQPNVAQVYNLGRFLCFFEKEESIQKYVIHSVRTVYHLTFSAGRYYHTI